MRLFRFMPLILALALTQGLYAQQDEAGAETDETVAEEEAVMEEEAMDEIVVTGSRIRRTEFSSTSPIAVITSETSALAGLLDSADILQKSTIASGQQIDETFSGFVTDGGPGSRSVSLRGFGEQRTLVLVNGKRWGPSGVRGGTNSVDLTALPSSIIVRYEILKDGASSIYGADAVAGVVNAITAERFDGLQVNVDARVPERGGAEAYTADLAWGRVGPDWSFSVAGAWSRSANMLSADRSWSECPRRPRYTDQDGDGTLDNTNPETGEPLCFGSIYGFAVSPLGWVRYEPSLGQLDPGNQYFSRPQAFGIPYFTTVPVHGWDPTSDPADPDPLYDNEGAFYRDEREPFVEDMYPERSLYSFTSFADKDFDIAGRSANAYYEFYYNRRETNINNGHRQFFPTVPCTNPTNPFGLNSPIGAFGCFRGTPVIMNYEFLDHRTMIEVDRYNTFAGLQGDISETWSYDVYAGYSYSNGTYDGQQLLDDRVTASLNSTIDANGNLVCADSSIPGCVAANLFTEDALLRGRLPADVVAFLVKDTLGETTYKSYQFSGYATGKAFDLPNGEDLNTVIGFEMRKESINDVPDPNAQTNNFWGFTTSGITTGDDTVREVFTEIEAPLLARLPLIEELVLNASGRWTDYNSYGSDTTYRVALDYQIVPLLRLRGTRGTSFRAPDLYEQFLANQTGFVSYLNDPCVNYGDQYDPDDIVYQNCQSQGLPPDHLNEGGAGITNVVGGNPNLAAETSDAWTAGVILQFEPLDQLGLSLALTWYEIELANSVASPSTGYILNTCYTSSGLSSAFCGRISPRDAAGNLTSIDASLVNIGQLVTRGYDADFLLEWEFPSFDLQIDGSINVLKEQTTQLFDTMYDSTGHWGYPEWSGELDILIDYRDWRFFWRMEVIGNTDEDPVFDPGTETVDRQHWTENHWEHTLSVRYTAADWEIIGTVRNIFNHRPPLVADGVPSDETTRVFNTLPGVGYDLLGRTFILQVAREF